MRLALITLLALAAALASAADARAGERAADPALVARLEAAGVPAEPLRQGLRAVACARARGEIESRVLALIDYTRPSDEPRLWVLDLTDGGVRFHERVAHGRESGLARARHFSNLAGSRQSSLGLFRTGPVYRGRHGYSLRLVGLEPGTNDRAEERGIVVHGARYATAEFVERHGRLGRSWGCPALDPAVSRELIDAIRDGAALFAWYPDPQWSARSPYLHCEPSLASDLSATPRRPLALPRAVR